jgi:peptidoglycan-associated lipoprotein
MPVRFIIALVAVLALACSPEKKIMKSFQLGHYQTVIDHYLKVLEKDPDNSKANFFVAESYRNSNRIRNAGPYYERVSGSVFNPDSVRFFYAEALRANGDYSGAEQELTKLINETKITALRDYARRQLEGVQSLEAIAKKQNYYKVKNLEAINTQHAEFSPVYLNGELYFTSSRSSASIYLATGTPYTDLYKVTTKGAVVSPETVKALPVEINDELRNEGCITFSPDGKTMVFARGNSKKKKGGGVDVDLYVARYRNNAWTAPVPININTQFRDESGSDAKNFSWDSTPSFSPDGRTLYFSSNRKGGFGGNDIYVAQVDSRGRFGKVRNLGPDINTPGDDMFPYLAENGKLYFASDGHPGFGMLDLFVVNRSGGRTVVENLGQPMNSAADDFGIFLFQPDRGFFTSNRTDGKGDDDIYTFKNDDPNLKVVNYKLNGVAYTYRKDSTLEVIPNARVTLLDSRDNVMQEYESGTDGKFTFRVFENENYFIVGEAEGFLTERESFTMIGKSVPVETLKELVTNISVDTIIVLPRKQKEIAFRLDKILFGYDSADIRPASARELDKLVQILIDNPDIKIELSSHTDSIGTYEKNMGLSERRAASSVKYLISKGITPERLVAKGYGETKPIARNTNPDGTDNPAGRQLNRRTEFRILEIGNIQVKKPVDEPEDDDDRFFKKNE